MVLKSEVYASERNAEEGVVPVIANAELGDIFEEKIDRVGKSYSSCTQSTSSSPPERQRTLRVGPF